MAIKTHGPGADYSALFAAQAAENARKFDGLNQPAQRQAVHRIAPPKMSANAQNVMASIMGRSTPNAGSALGKIASSWVTKYNADREAEQKRQYLNEQEQRRGVWAKQLHSGATLRDIATHDPGIMGDSAFLDFAKTTTPEVAAEVEIFEDVESPYGKGGFGQRSSTTGKITGYQSAPAQVKPAARATAKDKHGRLRYLDDGAVAFSDELLGPDPEPPAPGTSRSDQLKMVRQLSDDWRETVKPMQTLLDQSDRMNIGLKMAERGDMLAGSQAILISFNKLLDPTSVVRESEYARSATGQSALETMRGFVDRLSKGGAGVTLSELASYRRFGEQVVKGALESTVGPERKRIERLVEFAGVDPELIFTGRFATPEGPQQAAPQATPQGGAIADAAPPPPEIASSQAMMAAPTGQADAARVSVYSQLPADALKRQAVEMKANPAKYNDAERRAMSQAWHRKFGE